MVSKQEQRYTQAINTGMRLGKRLQRLARMLQYAKVGVVLYRLRPS